MTDKEGEEKKAPSLPPIQVNVLYTNVARVLHTMYDVAIDFGILMPDTPGSVAIQARVFMSPQHAKALFKALGENLKKYEGQFGLIPLPADVVIDKYIKEFFEEYDKKQKEKPGDEKPNNK